MKNTYLAIMLFCSLIGFAQQKTITGTITTEDGQPLPGVSIIVKNTSNGTQTDFDGKYTLNVNENDVIDVSYIGFKTISKVIDTTSIYNFILIEDAAQLDEVIVTGYSKEKKSDIAGAITVVNVSDVAQESSPNILTALQGRVPGIQINSGGTPGGNDTQIAIRGLSSIDGGTSPLWVIDGVQTFTPASLNPEDIESIQVLKDGASAAIYGTSAANGVIVVTTKKGKSGVSEFTFSAETTINMLRDKINALNAQQWLDVRFLSGGGIGGNEAPAGNFVPNGSGWDIPEFIDDNGLIRTADTDWVDTIFDETISSNFDFGYRKGTDKYNLYAALNYAKDEGIMRYTNYERFNARLNASAKFLNNKLTIGENFLFSTFNEVKGNELANAVLQNPLIPVFATDGSYAGPNGFQDKPNPLANLWSNRNNQQDNIRFLGNIYANYEIIDGLTFSTTLNVDYGTFKFNTATEAFRLDGVIPSVFQNITTEATNNDYISTIWTNLVSYNKTFKEKHQLYLMAGVENSMRDDNLKTELTRGVDITNPGGYLVRDDAEFQELTGKIEYRKLSQFGSVKYVFDDKYIVSASLRRDGSSRFGPNNKYGIFPAASVAWNVSNEDFIDKIKSISNLKFRASWGVNGNDLIGDYRYLASFIDNTVGNVVEFSDYDIDGNGLGTLSGVLQARQANPDIKWEETTQYNVGFDVGFFNNRLTFQSDFFRKDTENLLVTPIALAINGESDPPIINAGSLRNEGFEAVLSYRNQGSGDFQFGLDLNIATYTNEVTSLDTDANFLLTSGGRAITRKGDPIASFFGLIADGLFRTPEEVAVHAAQPGKGLGRIRYRDVNKDGVIDANDRTIIGSPHPDFIYGVNVTTAYKQFDLNLFFDGKHGNDLYNEQRNLGDFPFFGFNHGTNALDAWSPTNANSNIPALNSLNPGNELQPSSYFVEDGSYFRLKTITLGYNFTDKVAEKIGLNKLRLYVAGQNLINITSFTGFDYEVSGLSRDGIGIAGYGVPHIKSVTFGLNANF